MFQMVKKWVAGLNQLEPGDEPLPPKPKYAIVGEDVDHPPQRKPNKTTGWPKVVNNAQLAAGWGNYDRENNRDY